jgi:hypothetical protein
MDPWIWFVVGAAVVGFVAVGTRRGGSGGGFKATLKQAQKGGELEPLISAILAAPKVEQANRWDQALGHLWRTYERETAAKLAREAAMRSEDNIIQYWLKQIMEVEPEIASEHFDQAFLMGFFRPEVAKSCGRCGSCGCS